MPDDIFWEIHSDLPREGPGDNASTRRAFELMRGLPDNPRILDVACGPGMQTLELARVSPGKIVALDMHQPFLDELARRAHVANESHRIHIVHGSMLDLPFEEHSFDAIWCEGAMYIMGVRQALAEWHHLLAPGGFIAFTEPCFLHENVPDNVRQYWINDYAAMTDVSGVQGIIEAAGYELIGNFTIPDSSWWDDYYTPQLARLQMLRDKYRDQPKALARIEETQLEIDLHRSYAEHYGYVFFVIKSRGEQTP